VTALSGAVTETSPPKHLRGRVVAMVTPEPRRSFVFLPWTVSALLAIALLCVAIATRRSNAAHAGYVAKFAEALAIMNDPVAKDFAFNDAAARGRIFVGPRGVVLIAAHLPKLESNRTFELWIIPAAGNPIPAGTFSSPLCAYRGQTANAAAIAVTVEPEGGSPQPTTTPFIVTEL